MSRNGGGGCMTLIFILIMSMWALHQFFKPVWDRLMETVSGGR